METDGGESYSAGDQQQREEACSGPGISLAHQGCPCGRPGRLPQPMGTWAAWEHAHPSLQLHGFRASPKDFPASFPSYCRNAVGRSPPWLGLCFAHQHFHTGTSCLVAVHGASPREWYLPNGQTGFEQELEGDRLVQSAQCADAVWVNRILETLFLSWQSCLLLSGRPRSCGQPQPLSSTSHLKSEQKAGGGEAVPCCSRKGLTWPMPLAHQWLCPAQHHWTSS